MGHFAAVEGIFPKIPQLFQILFSSTLPLNQRLHYQFHNSILQATQRSSKDPFEQFEHRSESYLCSGTSGGYTSAKYLGFPCQPFLSSIQPHHDDPAPVINPTEVKDPAPVNDPVEVNDSTEMDDPTEVNDSTEMNDPTEVIDLTGASDDDTNANDVHTTESFSVYNMDCDENMVVPAWVDQTRIRPNPPGREFYLAKDRVLPETRRFGIIVGEMDTVVWEEDCKGYLYNRAQVAAYVNDKGRVEFRLAPKEDYGFGEDSDYEEGLPKNCFLSTGHYQNPASRPITVHDVLTEEEVDFRIQWDEYWEPIESELGLGKLKAIARSYIQVKQGGRWVDPPAKASW